MKKLFYILTFTFLVNNILISEEIDRKVTIQTNPVYYLIDLFSVGAGEFLIMDLEGQYKINDLCNVSLSISYLQYIYRYEYGNSFQIFFKPMFIFRPLKTGLEGFFIGLSPIIGFFDYGQYNYINDNYEKIKYTEIGFGVETGYKWIFSKGFTIQIGGGLGKTWTLTEWDRSGDFRSDGRIILPNYDVIFDFKIGYSF